MTLPPDRFVQTAFHSLDVGQRKVSVDFGYLLSDPGRHAERVCLGVDHQEESSPYILGISLLIANARDAVAPTLPENHVRESLALSLPV